ncbi:MAG: AAA family ATPase, partial [Desulfovibrionaceae bacterium]|nr:AAA family ATPase [Desulfovibrionaceae bacterium]
NLDLLFSVRAILKSFYKIIDSCNNCFRFIIIAGEEKYQNTGIFSTLNSIHDISKHNNFEKLLGFSFLEIKKYFAELISNKAKDLNLNLDNFLEKISEFSQRDTSIYQPKAFMEALEENRIDNYPLYLQKYNFGTREIYTVLNPGDNDFLESRESNFYVDKSELLIYTNQFINTDKRYICISRPRRFGKTTAANMVASYYDQTGDASSTFKDLKITKDPSFKIHKNKYIVIKLNIANFLSQSHDIDILIEKIKTYIYVDLIKQFDKTYANKDLNVFMRAILLDTGRNFVIVVDEWDCILREFKDKED